MSVLVAVDLIDASDGVLKRGCELARELDCEALVLHVVDPSHPPGQRPQYGLEAHHALSLKVAGLAAEIGVRGSVEVIAEGSRADATVRSHAAGAALIVASVPDRTGSVLTGAGEHTGGRLIKSTSAPLLLVKSDGHAPYRRTVVGIDFSSLSRAALDHALRVTPNADLYLVHAWHVPHQGSYRKDAMAGEIESGERAEMEAFLRSRPSVDRELKHPLPEGRKIEVMLHEGKPVEVLRSECSRLDAHLLVMGTHGKPGISRLIWGSVAAGLLSDPPCDVLFVRSPG
jgi:nucleotide-binding universal stress UspA family protein